MKKNIHQKSWRWRSIQTKFQTSKIMNLYYAVIFSTANSFRIGTRNVKLLFLFKSSVIWRKDCTLLTFIRGRQLWKFDFWCLEIVMISNDKTHQTEGVKSFWSTLKSMCRFPWHLHNLINALACFNLNPSLC